jgi:hypothetical protein
MATCSHCGTTILFGGEKEAGLRFCNAKCRDNSVLLAAATQLPEEFVIEKARDVHQGACPKCGGPGPVDVHHAHTVWSAVVMTQWNSKPHICCRSCGVKAKANALAISGVAGWWGFPWGMLVTPIQIFRNLAGIMRGPDPAAPSDELIGIVRSGLSVQLLEEEHEQPPSPAAGT